MNVLFAVHWEFSVRTAGSERYTDFVQRELVKQGHNVRFLVEEEMKRFCGKDSYVLDNGVEVVVVQQGVNTDEFFEWADIVWTHLNLTRFAIQGCQRFGKPLVIANHAQGQVPLYEVKRNEVDLMVYNSDWLRDDVEPDFKHPNVHVLVPPMDAKSFAVDDRSEQRFITHLNCNAGKGVMYARHWAKEMPEYPFLFVLGGYFKQFVSKGFIQTHKDLHIPMQEIDYPNNVTFISRTQNVLDDVLKKTKIAVVPSTIDSWGMFALECYAAGIPVIAHPDKGFLESMGYGGLFVDRLKARTNCDLLTKLMEDEAYFSEQQAYALRRAAEVEELSKAQLNDLIPKMQALVDKAGK